MSVTTITQIAATFSNVAISVIFIYIYWKFLKLQRYTINEQREQRISGGRPQVIVEADYRRMPEIDLVVRNVGGGPAKNISFDFSANIKSSTGFVLTDLFYLRDGMDFLAPGGEIRCLWDDLESLEQTLKEEGLEHGIRVYTQYEGMSGDDYHTEYGINPLLYQGIRNANRRDMDDLVELLDDRLPGGDSGGSSPDSAEEFEKQQEEAEENGEEAAGDEPAAGDETADEDETADGDRSVWPFPSSAGESDGSEPDNRRPRVK